MVAYRRIMSRVLTCLYLRLFREIWSSKDRRDLERSSDEIRRSLRDLGRKNFLEVKGKGNKMFELGLRLFEYYDSNKYLYICTI